MLAPITADVSRTPKPKLSNRQRITIARSDRPAPGLGSQTPAITIGETKEPLLRRSVRTVIGAVIAVVALLFATYAVLAATVLVVLPASAHHVAVLRNTFPVGAAPQGAYVYASSEPVDTSVTGRINQAVFGVAAGSVVRIVAGPAVRVATDRDGYIVVDGHRTDYKGKVAPQYLNHAYVAICVSGACKAGAAVLVGQANIVGGVKGYVTLSGITQPRTPGQPLSTTPSPATSTVTGATPTGTTGH